MRLSEAGERRIVETVRTVLGAEDPADDCARLEVGGVRLAASTDVVLAASHFPDIMTPLQRGAYAAAVNLSDLAACGADPVGLLVALGLPSGTDLDDVETMVRGVRTMADRFDCPVLGGDTKPADQVLVAGAALGLIDGDGMPRAAARPGQVLCVTGSLGGAGLGHRRWQEGATADDEAVQRFLMPAPRIHAGRALARIGAAACMDLSDGLAYSLHRMAEASDAGLLVRPKDLPRFPQATPDDALYAAGDFELLCTLPADRLDDAVQAVQEAGGSLTAIGEVVQDGVWMDEDGDRAPLEDRGWEHFAEG